MNSPGESWGEESWRSVKRERDVRFAKSRARMLREQIGVSMRDNEVRAFDSGRLTNRDIPVSLIPGMLSKRSEESAGRAQRVASTKDAAGNDETCRCANEGKALNTETNSA